MEGMLNYFIPEDGDSSDHLNVVPLPRVDQLRLQHIKKSFPLPGEFHFRFKTPFEGTYVWLDVVNDSDVVPDYNGLIISKIARVQSQSSTRPPERVEAKAPSAPAPDLIETSPPPAQAKREESPAPAKTFNDDLVGLLSDPVPSTSPGPSTPVTSTPQPNPSPPDPFNLFMGSNTTPMRPTPSPMNAPRGPASNPNPNSGGYVGGPQYAPMGGPGTSSPMGPPRPAGNMNISQMHMGMNQVPSPHQQQQNSFQGLQWQGMGQQQPQQQRNPMQNPSNRQW